MTCSAQRGQWQPEITPVDPLLRCRDLSGVESYRNWGQSFALSLVSPKRASIWLLNILVGTPIGWDTCWCSTSSPGKDLENTHVSALEAQGTQLLMTSWVSTPTPSPGELLDTKGDALGSPTRISCVAGAAPCTGQPTKGHGLCKRIASVAQECPDHRSPS